MCTSRLTHSRKPAFASGTDVPTDASAAASLVLVIGDHLSPVTGNREVVTLGASRPADLLQAPRFLRAPPRLRRARISGGRADRRVRAAAGPDSSRAAAPLRA